MSQYASYSGFGGGGSGGSGTVTAVSVVPANGFSGTVLNPTTTPAITISTTITGLLQGDGTALSAYVGGSLVESTSNVLTIGNGANAVIGTGTTLTVKQAATAQSGYLSSTDWNTFNGKQAALTFGNLTSSDVTVGNGTGSVIGTGTTLTLATVNSNVGNFGSSTAIPTVTVNAKGLVTAIANASPAPTPSANAVSYWDANSNFTANNDVIGFQAIATAAATSTFTIASPYQTNFTGSTTQTVLLPVVTTLVNGFVYKILNQSTGVVTVQSSGANVIQAMAANTQLLLTCVNTAGGTGIASWAWTYSIINGTQLPNSTTFMDLTTAQTAAGVKTFSSNPVLSANATAGVLLNAAGGAITSSAGALAVANGGTAKTTVTIAPTASSWAGWDANSNLSAKNHIQGYTTTATAAGTTTLVVGSTYEQYFTGATTQTVVLPVATTLVNGQSFLIVNNSTGLVTVNTSGAVALQVVPTGGQVMVTCINTAGGTGIASWGVTNVGAIRSEVWVYTASGYGSTNTCIRTWTTIGKSVGDIVYAASATLGDTFTVGSNGLYTIAYADSFTGNAGMGISVNSTQLSTAIGSINAADRRIAQPVSAGAVTISLQLTAADVVRAHADTTAVSSPVYTSFRITKVGV